jgi:hypothetical protein
MLGKGLGGTALVESNLGRGEGVSLVGTSSIGDSYFFLNFELQRLFIIQKTFLFLSFWVN